MAGPGGDEVGRVSIRVVPDTDGFRRALQNAVREAEAGLEVTIPVNFDVDTAGLRTQLEAIDQSRITIPVDLDLQTAALRAQLQALDNSRVTIPVDLDLRDEARINAVLQRLRNRAIRINVRLNGVSQAIARLTALDVIVRRLDGRTININVDVDAGAAAAQLAALQAAMSGIRVGLGSLNTSAGGVTRSFSGMASVITTAVTAAALLPPLATAIVVAGAGIAAAWGGISTAIMAIPPAMLLLAAPIATVMTGMEGIKRAAQTLNPEIAKLRNLLNATFQTGFTQVFDKLRAVFPALTAGMHDTAHALINISMRLAEMVSSGPGIARIEAVFRNINTALNTMSPGIASIVDGFLVLGSQSSIFDVLSTAVNTFGTEFRSAILRVTGDSKVLDNAMRGLSGLIDELTQGFFHLVTNGMELFAAAAPGVNKFLDSLTNFFNRFDWNALGQSVSKVFDGLGKALDKIPQGTIDKIVAGFEKLGNTFQDPAFQQGIAGWADAIPVALDGLNALAQAFAQVGRDMNEIIEVFKRVGQALSGLGSILEGVGLMTLTFAEMLINPFMPEDRYEAQIAEAKAAITGGMTEIADAFTRPWPQIQASGSSAANLAIQGMTDTFLSGANQFGTDGGNALNQALSSNVPPSIESGLQGAGPAVGQGLGAVANEVPAALSPAEQALSDAIAKFPPVIQQGFANLSVPVAAGMAMIVQGINNGVPMMEGAVVAGMARVATALATGTAQWVVAIMTGMTAVTSVITAQSTQWTTAMTTAMTALATTISTGFQMLAVQATAGMQAVTLAIAAETANWVVALMQANTAMQTTVTAGFAILAAQATVGMAAVTLAISVGTAQWVVAIMTGMTALQLAVQNGFLLLAATATAGMLQVQLAIAAGVFGWQLAIQQGFLLMQQAMQLGFLQMQMIAIQGMALFAQAILQGFALVVPAVQLGMALIVLAVQQGFLQIVAAVVTGMAQVTAALQLNWAVAVAATTAAMAQMVAAVVAGMAQMVAATQQGWAQMTQAAIQGTQQMVAAVTTGANQMVAALQSAIQRCVSILNAAVGQFRAAGANMGQALADGLNSKVGAVQAAANRLAQAAAAATRAAAGIRSPSRVFIAFGEYMGEGLAIGMRHSETEVERAARSLASTVIDEASRIEDAFAGDQWAADFNARLNAELAQHEIDLSGGAKGGQAPVQVVQNFNVPSAERASDRAAHNMRRLGAMGLFCG